MEHNSFDALVSGLTETERVTMLEKMKGIGEESQSLASEDKFDDAAQVPFEKQIKNESIFFRIFLWFKALFANTSVQALYREHLVTQIARHLERLSPDILDSRRCLLLSSFYNKLSELKICADFFRPFISYAEADEDSFLIFLGSIMMREVEEKINGEVDPYTLPFENGPRPELRTNLLHKLDDILDGISPEQRTKMYEAVRAYEWIKQFTKLPFMRFIGLFTSVTEENFCCPFASVENELASFSRIMCNGMKIPEEVLEAVYLFSKKRSSAQNIDSLEENADRASAFMGTAKSQIAMMKMFITSVPLKYVGRIVYCEPSWMPESFAGGEDWFVRFKTDWRKLFEQKWKSWCVDCKKENLKLSLKRNFELETFPSLPERPWTQIWGGIPFCLELTAGFLNWYLHEKFTENEFALKTVMLEGDFVRKENRTEFNEAFNKIIQISVDFQSLNRALSSGGEYGIIFQKLRDEKLHSLQAHSKIETIVRNVEGDMRSMISGFCDSCRSIEKCFTGIFRENTDTRYDSLSNFSHLGGKNSEGFMDSLCQARQSLLNSYEMVMELEQIDRQNLVR